MGIENIILRTVTHSPLVTKGSTLTWPEEDGNFIEIYDAIYALQNPDVTLFEAYSAGTEYESGDYVSYSGNIWRFINAIPATGITPGTDPLTWELASIGEFAHQQNKDQYLDYGGPNQVSAAEIYSFLNAGTADFFLQGGNSFTATAVIGTNDAFDLNFETNGTARGGITDTGEWMLGTVTPFLDAFVSILSTGNDSTTESLRIRNSDSDDMMWLSDNGNLSIKSTMNNLTPVFTAYDNSDVLLYELQANANIKAPGNFIDVSDLATMFPYGRQLYLTNGSTVAYAWGSGVFKKTDGQDVANMLFQYLATGGAVDLHWGEHRQYGDWKVQGDLKVAEATTTKGLVLYDRTIGTYFRLFLDNGALNIEAE